MASFASVWSGLQQAGNPVPYMLIDCAGLDGGEARLPREAFSEIECLFTGDLAIELANVGPYLGRLRSYAPAVQAVAQDLLDKHVGLLVVLQDGGDEHPEVTFSQLHRHFRKFNVVYDPAGKPLFFRYCDPRVLLDVLAVLTAEQLDAFFGPAVSLVLVGDDGESTQCSRQHGALVVCA